MDTHSDECKICGNAGMLLCCDTCEDAFHLSCLGKDTIPDGFWQCDKCEKSSANRAARRMRKEGPTATPEELAALVRALHPHSSGPPAPLLTRKRFAERHPARARKRQKRFHGRTGADNARREVSLLRKAFKQEVIAVRRDRVEFNARLNAIDSQIKLLIRLVAKGGAGAGGGDGTAPQATAPAAATTVSGN